MSVCIAYVCDRMHATFILMGPPVTGPGTTFHFVLPPDDGPGRPFPTAMNCFSAKHLFLVFSADKKAKPIFTHH